VHAHVGLHGVLQRGDVAPADAVVPRHHDVHVRATVAARGRAVVVVDGRR
jgi:hypothetical protein